MEAGSALKVPTKSYGSPKAARLLKLKKNVGPGGYKSGDGVYYIGGDWTSSRGRRVLNGKLCTVVGWTDLKILFLQMSGGWFVCGPHLFIVSSSKYTADSELA